MAQSKLIPNTFQHPNVYVDWISFYLTPEEEKVLNKAIREILGWHNKIENRRARIALSVFVDGKRSKDTGEQLCLGCGLGRSAVRKALKELDKFKILVKVGEPTQDGQMYKIQEDCSQVDLAGLEKRRQERTSANNGRTEKARIALEEKRGTVAQKGYCRTDQGGIVGQTKGVLSDSTKETQVETQIENRVSQEISDDDSQFPTDSPLSSLGDQSLPTQEERKITSYTDPGSMAAEVYRRTGGKQSWTEVSQEERQGHKGYDGEPVDAFCEIHNMSGVPLKKRKLWGKWLFDIGENWESDASEVAKAIKAIRASKEHGWRTFTVPTGKVFGGLIGQMIDVVRLGPPKINLDTFNYSGAYQPGRR